MNCHEHFESSRYQQLTLNIMGRIFHTSTPNKPRRAAPIPGRENKPNYWPVSKQSEKAGFQNFYKIQKTRLTARYAFLPFKQIERRIKQLWETSSAEKRAEFCSTLPGTTAAKSPFRGTILKGLRKSLNRSVDTPGSSRERGRARDFGRGDPLFASPPSSKQQPRTPRQGILKSSDKRRVSTPRVSFRLDEASLPSPIPVHHHTRRVLNEYMPPVPMETAASVEHTLAPFHPDGKTHAAKIEVLRASVEEDAQERLDNVKKVLSSCDDLIQATGIEVECLSKVDVDLEQNTDEQTAKGRNAEQRCTTREKVKKKNQTKLKEYFSPILETDGGKGTKDDHVGEEKGTPVRRSTRTAALAANNKIASPMAKQRGKESVKENMAKRKSNLDSPSDRCVVYRLKKTELTPKEKEMYEFEDEASNMTECRPKKGVDMPGSQMVTRPRRPVQGPRKPPNPEEYNLDSNINKNVFGKAFDQSPAILQEGNQPNTCKISIGKKGMKAFPKGEAKKPSKKRGRPRKSVDGENKGVNKSSENTVKRKRGRPKKSAPMASQSARIGDDSKMSQEPPTQCLSDQLNKQAKNQGTGRKKMKIQTLAACSHGDKHEIDDDERDEVPWMVTARPPSSSSEECDEDNDVEDDEIPQFQYYRYGSNDLDDSSPSLPSSSSALPDDEEQSPAILSSSQRLCESFERFCQDSLDLTPKGMASAAAAAPRLPGLMGSMKPMSSLVSGDVVSERSDGSMCSMTSLDAAEVMSLSTEYSASQGTTHSESASPQNLRKEKLYARKPAGVDRSELSRMVAEFPTTKPTSRKKKMRLQDGEVTDCSQASEGGSELMERGAGMTSSGSRRSKMRGRHDDDPYHLITENGSSENSARDIELRESGRNSAGRSRLTGCVDGAESKRGAHQNGMSDSERKSVQGGQHFEDDEHFQVQGEATIVAETYPRGDMDSNGKEWQHRREQSLKAAEVSNGGGGQNRGGRGKGKHGVTATKRRASGRGLVEGQGVVEQGVVEQSALGDDRPALVEKNGISGSGGSTRTRNAMKENTALDSSNGTGMMRMKDAGKNRRQAERRGRKEESVDQERKGDQEYQHEADNQLESEIETASLEERLPSSGGLLCDLFASSEPSSQKPWRSITSANKPSQQEDPASTYLFLEENIFM